MEESAGLEQNVLPREGMLPKAEAERGMAMQAERGMAMQAESGSVGSHEGS